MRGADDLEPLVLQLLVLEAGAWPLAEMSDHIEASHVRPGQGHQKPAARRPRPGWDDVPDDFWLKDAWATTLSEGVAALVYRAVLYSDAGRRTAAAVSIYAHSNGEWCRLWRHVTALAA